MANNHKPNPIQYDPNFTRATVVVTSLKTGHQVMVLKDFKANEDQSNINDFFMEVTSEAAELGNCKTSCATVKCYEKQVN